MKKFIAAFIFGLTFVSIAIAGIEPIANCAAFARYQTRPKTELSKLVYLLERYNLPGVEIKIDGNIYQAEKTFPFGKLYLAMNYHKEPAAEWVRKYCYRSPFKNQVMLFRLPGEDFGPARDFLLKALAELEKADSQQSISPICDVPARVASGSAQGATTQANTPAKS